MMLLDVGQRLDSFMPVRQTTDASGASSERRRAYDDGDRSVQGGHSHGHHGRAGGLGQALRQTLDQLGISVGGRRDGGSSSGTSTGTTTTTTITITITTSTGANPAVSTTTDGNAPATTAPVTTQPVTTDPTDTTTPIKTPAASTSPIPSTDGDADAAPSSSRADLHALMHALFQAVRGEAGQGSGHGLSDALGSLATDAANGTAPSALQEAFDRLIAGGPTSADDSTPTLQQFLLALQQNLGGSDSGTGHTLPYQPTGNLLAILA